MRWWPASATENQLLLEKDGLVIRTDLSGRVRHVEYSLSNSFDIAALKLIETLTKWGTEY